MYWHLLFKLAHLVTALAAINIGLSPSGYNVCANQSFMGTCGQYMTYGSYAIGVCGALCLLHFVLKLMKCGGCCCKAQGPCSCGAKKL
jgi:hypothetical protein